MANRKLILHIGRQKTGTTAIQSHLSYWRDELLDHGFWYPESPGGQIAHHDLAVAIENERVLASRWPEVVQSQSDASTTLLSSEAFQRVPPQRVAEVVSDYSTQVIVYLREHYRGAQSSYCQAVQARRVTFSFDEFLSRQTRTLTSFLDSWVSAFGVEAILPRTYPAVIGDIRVDFAEAAGLPILDGQSATLSNPSIGGDLLRFKLVLNRLELPELELRKVAYGPIGRIAATASKWRTPPEASAEARKDFLDLARVDRESLRRDYGIDLGEIPTAVGEQVQDPDLAAVAQSICKVWQADSPHSFGQLHELVSQVSVPQGCSDEGAQCVADAILA